MQTLKHTVLTAALLLAAAASAAPNSARINRQSTHDTGPDVSLSAPKPITGHGHTVGPHLIQHTDEAVFAAPNPAECNRKLVRGNGPAVQVPTQKLVTLRGNPKTPHIVNRYTRTASDREAIRQVCESNAVSSIKLNTEPTAFQKNHHN